MNDDLQKALAEILNKTAQGVEAGVGFLQRELPEVVQQVLIWHGVKSAVYFTSSVLLAVMLALLAKKMWGHGRAYKNSDYYDDGREQRFVASGVAAVASGGAIASAVYNITWLQILLAPKLYLIEYAASLVK